MQINLPVCVHYNRTDQEKKEVDEHLEGMADGFICDWIKKAIGGTNDLKQIQDNYLLIDQMTITIIQ